MPDTTYILIAAVALLVVALIAVALWSAGRSRRLRRQFGPEYDRTVETAGKRRLAERELEARRQRIDKLELRELDAEERREFGSQWRRLQVDFVDRPKQAVEGADKLVTAVMLARGYPGGDFEQRAADVSVDHSRLIPDYRQARQIAERSRRGEATTEELRQSLVSYRNLFVEMLGAEETLAESTAATTTTRGLPH